jgi:hypothetical protein
MTDGVFNNEPPVTPSATPDPVVDQRLQAKDMFIDQLKQENAEMREELAKRAEIEKLLEEARNKAANPPPPREAQPAAQEPAKSINPDELVERVLEVQSQRDAEARGRANATEVTNRLIETFGSAEAANKVVAAKAAELGVGVEFLLDAAKRSPSAFYQLTNIDSHAPTPQPAPVGDVNTAALKTHAPGVKPGTAAYYEQLKNELGPVKFYTPQIQQQRMKDAIRLGDAFYT